MQWEIQDGQTNFVHLIFKKPVWCMDTKGEKGSGESNWEIGIDT